jgi:hypothetical protein
MSEPKERGAAWSEERGTIDEQRRRDAGGRGRYASYLRTPRRRAGDTAHLDPDVLAEFRAGLISGRRGARIGAHLVACDRCAALDNELAGVSALLATVPAAAMPDGVAHRLDAALAAEVAQRNIYAERADGNSSRKAGMRKRPTGDRGFRWAGWRVVAPAAAVVLLAAGGYELSHLGGGPVTQGAASSASRAVAAPGHAANSADEAVPPAAGAARSAPTAGVRRVSPAAFPLVVSRTVFLAATFEQQVKAALRTPAADRTTQPASSAVRACVQAVTGGAQPVLVESARFGNQPATIIAVRAGQGYAAWAAGSRCSAANRDLLAKTTVP